MKKVIFGATALLFSGAILAQGPVSQDDLKDVNGTNSQDTQTAAYFGASGGNSTEAHQTGNINKLEVKQAGALQSVYTEQGDGSGTGDNRARIWQTGEVSPPPSGFANFADVRQLGSQNQSQTYQEGDFNEAITRQGLKDASSSGNRALIQHGTGQQGEGNYAMVEQDGTDNRSKTIQSFDGNQARTVQVGDANAMRVRQLSGPDGSSGNTALAEQYGSTNNGITFQNGHDQEAHLVQTGANNMSNQTQLGERNRGVVDQGQGLTDDVFTTFGGTTANIDALADSDYSFGSGGSDSQGGKALQVQDGDDNDAYIGQFGSSGEDSNYGEQNQDGNNNSASLNQNAFGTATGGANYGRQDQEGGFNMALMGQNGRDHKAYQRQIGDANVAVASQKGTANLVSTYQGGDNNLAISGQRGHDNQILAVQMSDAGAGHTFLGRQNVADGGLPNGGNTMNVLQLGPDGDINGTFPGCDFQDQETLNGASGPGNIEIDAPCGASGC